MPVWQVLKHLRKVLYCLNSTRIVGLLLFSDTCEILSVGLLLFSDTCEIVSDDGGSMSFSIAHHYESNVKAAGDVNNASRARRLAQEAVTLSTSLPLSYSSSVFVRCDEDRLDLMKVSVCKDVLMKRVNTSFKIRTRKQG